MKRKSYKFTKKIHSCKIALKAQPNQKHHFIFAISRFIIATRLCTFAISRFTVAAGHCTLEIRRNMRERGQNMFAMSYFTHEGGYFIFAMSYFISAARHFTRAIALASVQQGFSVLQNVAAPLRQAEPVRVFVF